MKLQTNATIANLQRTNSADITGLIANLENSRERQMERSNALRREAAMKAVQLDQQKRLNWMLLALLGALGVAIIALLCFGRYRERTNREIQALQIKALSAEKMKTEFLGLINHELRTPLNAVIGISDAMIHHSPDANIRTQAQAIQDSGEQLFDLLESLIDMSTIEADKMVLSPDETDVAEVLRVEAARWNRWADAKGLIYTQFIAPALSRTTTVDAVRIRQCAKFLLSNAVRFTQSGRVHLHATAEEQDGALLMSLVVADTGQGISQAVQDRLFRPFVQADATMTRKYGGAGLSLSIARKLARMMDGDLVLTSAVDRGTEFTLTARLPLSVQSCAEQTAQPGPRGQGGESEQPARKPGLDGAVVLVVENRTRQQDVVRTWLVHEGADCVAALSGAEALRMLSVGRFDAVVLNVRMDGLETARRIRGSAAHADTPIVVVGTNARADDRNCATAAGADVLLSESVTESQLVRALSAAMKRGRKAAQPVPAERQVA